MDVKMQTILGLLCAIAVVSVRSTSPPFPFCVGDMSIYSPCQCDKMFGVNTPVQAVYLICNNVEPSAMKDVFNRMRANNKTVGKVIIKNTQIIQLSDGQFGEETPFEIRLNIPSLTSLQPSVFNGTEESVTDLYINGGLLTEVPIDVYSFLKHVKSINILNMPTIKVLDKDKLNMLENIETIETFYVSNASISKIDVGTFSSFISLKHLILDGNPISELPFNALPPQNLTSISLSSTKITRVPVELMTKMDGEGWLSLANIGVVNVEEDWIKMAIEYGTLLNLRDNPLHCGSSMCVMVEELSKDPSHNPILGHCDSPPSLAFKWLPGLSYQHLNCTY